MKNKIKKFCVDYIKWNPPFIVFLCLFIIFSMGLTLLIFRLDNDFWFLINTGEYIVNNGMPNVDPFVIHSGFSLTVQQWLTDVLFYFIYSKFNIFGILYLVNLISFVIFVLIYNLSMVITDNKRKLSFCLTVIVGCILQIAFLTTRPYMFDIMFVLLEIFLLESYIKKGKKILLVGLPLISLFMINLHASIWPMLFIILIPYFVEKIVQIKYFDKEKYNIFLLLVVMILMFLCGFINPNGIKSITYLFNSFGVDVINNGITEMRALTINSSNGIVIFGLIFIVLFSYYLNKSNNFKLRYFLLFLGTCYLSLSHFRGALFLFIASVLSLSYNLKYMIKVDSSNRMFYDNIILNMLYIFIIILVFGAYIFIVYNSNLKEENIHNLSAVADYLDTLVVDKNNIKVYTNYNDGGYLEYRGYKVYIDPRAEVFLKKNNKKEDILEEFFNLQYGDINSKDFLTKYNFDYLVVSEEDILYTYIDSNDNYEVVFEEKDDLDYRLYKNKEITN